LVKRFTHPTISILAGFRRPFAMRILFYAAILSALTVIRCGSTNASDPRTEKLHDRLTQAAEKLRNDQLSLEERQEILNDLRQTLNAELVDGPRQRAGRSAAERESRQPSPEPQHSRRELTDDRLHVFEHFERARREFEAMMQRLESLNEPGAMRAEPAPPTDDQPDRGRNESMPPEAAPRIDARRSGRGNQRPETRFAIGLLLIVRPNAAQPELEIASIPADSAAAEADLREGDVILRADGQRVENARELTDHVQTAGREGRSIELTIRRGEEELVIGVRPREHTHGPGDLERSVPWWQHMGPQGPGAFDGSNRWLLPPQPPAITGFPQQPPHTIQHELNQVREEVQRLRREINELREMLKKSVESKKNAPVIDL